MLRFLDFETNQVQRRSVPAVCRILRSNVWSLSGNLSDMTVLRLSMIYILLHYGLLLWIYVTYRRCWFQDLIAMSCCAGAGCLWLEGWLHKCELYLEHFVNPNLSVTVAECKFFMFCSLKQ